jgi:hypothetical protein
MRRRAIPAKFMSSSVPVNNKPAKKRVFLLVAGRF